MKKMTRNLMILAVAVMPVACGNLSPTSPNEAASAGSSAGTVTSAGFTRPRTSPGAVCAAQGIALTQSSGLRIAAQLVDSNGSPVSADGCSAFSWNVSPDGAYVQQLSVGPAGSNQVELVVVGLPQTYTVTANSAKLSASIDITF